MLGSVAVANIKEWMIFGKEKPMDTGNGHFEIANTIQELEEKARGMAKHGGIFTVGEEIELKGSYFRIKSIKPKELRLKLLPLRKIL